MTFIVWLYNGVFLVHYPQSYELGVAVMDSLINFDISLGKINISIQIDWTFSASTVWIMLSHYNKPFGLAILWLNSINFRHYAYQTGGFNENLVKL